MNFKKRVNGSWVDTPYYIHQTVTDTLTTLPAVLYPNDTTATVGLKGQMVQSGTPTPTTPIQPSECGDLETTGEHAGQYKIPILNNSQTTNVYLGEVQTTRKIKKWVLTGEEEWQSLSTDGTRHYLSEISPDYMRMYNAITYRCSHYSAYPQTVSATFVPNLQMAMAYSTTAQRLYITDPNHTTDTDFKAYLAQQYAAGTPVCVWYVLATEETAVVNEPIRKIGDYADIVSGITIPVTAGANTIDVDTTLKPSEVSVNYHGWHPVTDVHERINGAWT